VLTIVLVCFLIKTWTQPVTIWCNSHQNRAGLEADTLPWCHCTSAATRTPQSLCDYNPCLSSGLDTYIHTHTHMGHFIHSRIDFRSSCNRTTTGEIWSGLQSTDLISEWVSEQILNSTSAQLGYTLAIHVGRRWKIQGRRQIRHHKN